MFTTTTTNNNNHHINNNNNDNKGDQKRGRGAPQLAPVAGFPSGIMRQHKHWSDTDNYY